MQTKLEWKIDKKDFDFSVNPANDFFQYANGGWLSKNPIPKTETRWGSFYVLRRKNKIILRSILGEILKTRNVKYGSDLGKLKNLYKTGMDAKKRNERRAKDLQPLFTEIESLSSRDEIISLLARLHTIGVDALFHIFVDQDLKKSGINTLYFYQGGIGLPDRDYYFKKDSHSKKIRTSYGKHIENIFILLGRRKNEARLCSRVVLELETKLADVSMTKTERRDWEKQHNVFTRTSLSRHAPRMDWVRYFKGTRLGSPGSFIVCQPAFLKRVNALVTEVSISHWKIYLSWCLASAFSGALSDDFAKEDFNFYGKILSGQKKMKPRWETVLGFVESACGEILGKEYVRRHFTDRDKKMINTLVDDLMAVYEERMKMLSWMGSKTKKRAIHKLRAIKRKLGYPKKWRNYRALQAAPDSYVLNVIRAHEFEFKKAIKKIGKKVDKHEWHMSPQTVNAYYNPGLNEIVFPAGIIQPPFYHSRAHPAYNYGAIGAVIGHELTHGFDDEGSKFDLHGNLNDWWEKSDRQKFMKRANKLVQQFNRCELFKGAYVNGKLTLGENIADLGGLVLAYDAYRRFKKRNKIRNEKIFGFTDEEIFFIGAATVERGKTREETARQQLIIDPHSPPKFRVNVPLSNMDEFYEVFHCKKGNTLFRDKKERVSIW